MVLRIAPLFVAALAVTATSQAPFALPSPTHATFSNTGQISITDSDTPPTQGYPYPSVVHVSGMVGRVKEVRLTLTYLTHTAPGDIDIALECPASAGTFGSIIVMSDVGGTTDVNNAVLVFSDDAPAVMPNAPIASGNYRPTNYNTGDSFPGAFGASPAPAGSATFDSIFGGKRANGDWLLYVVDDFAQDRGDIIGGWSLTITTEDYPTDYDADTHTDWAITRATAGGRLWAIQNSQGALLRTFGTSTDIPVPADFTGDGIADFGVWREGAPARFFYSKDGLSASTIVWGTTGDDPRVTADYFGGGIAIPSVYRAGASPGAQSYWHIYQPTFPVSVPWGVAGDTPAPGDYDGDRRSDFAVRRDVGGGQAVFWLLQSVDGIAAIPWGTPTDRIVAGDFDGDARADLAVTRDVGGTLAWYVRRSSNGTLMSVPWGQSATDTPAPGDYDGDGKTDLAVWRSTNGTFYVLRSSDGGLIAQPWGTAGDLPLTSFFVH